MNTDTKNFNPILEGPIAKQILLFFFPIVFGTFFQQLYNTVDSIIVGNYIGSEALAAVGATGSVVFLILGFTQGLTTGFTVMTAQRFGAGDREGMKKSIDTDGIIFYQREN